MIIIYGSRLYGKVDVVPGLFHVETKFGHLWYIPLIPVGTYVVLSKNGNEWQGVPIRMSFKSILFGWLRAALLIGSAVFAILALGLSKEQEHLWVMPTVVSVFCAAFFALFTYHKSTTRASYDRARQLGEAVGLNDHGIKMIDDIYGFGDRRNDPFAMKGEGF